jgi:hypothetical protein
MCDRSKLPKEFLLSHALLGAANFRVDALNGKTSVELDALRAASSMKSAFEKGTSADGFPSGGFTVIAEFGELS